MTNAENAGWDIAVCNDTSPVWEFCCGALQGIDKCCSHDRFTISNTTNEFLNQRQWETDTNTTSSSNSSSVSSSTPSTAAATCVAAGSFKDKGAQIGIGAGLGVPLLIALGLLFWENKKRRQAEAIIAQRQEDPEDDMQQSHRYEAMRVYEAGETKSAGNELPSPPVVHELR